MLRLHPKATHWILKAMLSSVFALGLGFLLLLLHQAAGLPSVRALKAYLPERQLELAPQQCIRSALTIVPTVTTTKIEPALLAAEGPDTSVAISMFRPPAGKRGHYSIQIARGMLCEDRRSQIGRSIDELILALEIDTFYSPEERHTIYLNRAYFGDDQFGIAAASEHYFSKGPDRLTVAESALLTSLPWAPAMLSPYKHPDQALARRNLVLASMQQQGSISAEVATMAEAAPLLTRQ